MAYFNYGKETFQAGSGKKHDKDGKVGVGRGKPFGVRAASKPGTGVRKPFSGMSGKPSNPASNAGKTRSPSYSR